MVYEHIVHYLFPSRRITPTKKRPVRGLRVPCLCPRPPRITQPHLPKLAAIPVFLRPPLMAEFTNVLVRETTVAFSCTCDLWYHLHNSADFCLNLRKLRIHWTGPRSKEAFGILQSCTGLEELTVLVSLSTLQFPSELVLWQREYFNHAFNRLRLTDCAGFDELLGIRGLKYVAALAGIPGCRKGTGKYVHADAIGLQLALKASASGHIQHQS